MKTLLTLIALALLLVSCEKEELITKDTEIVIYNVEVSCYNYLGYKMYEPRRNKQMMAGDTMLFTCKNLKVCCKWTKKDSIITTEFIKASEYVLIYLNQKTGKFEINKKRYGI